MSYTLKLDQDLAIPIEIRTGLDEMASLNPGNDLRITKSVAPVRHQLVDSVRRAIFEFTFKPGEKLIERELCDMFGVSRTSLREGLRQLEAEGLIEIIPHKGPVVAQVTPKQAKEIYEIRAVLEGHLGRKAAERADAKSVRALRKNFNRVKKVLKSRDRIGIIAAKAEFYSILLDIAGNEELTDVLRKYFGRLSLLWPTMIIQSSEAEGSLDEISAIIGAIEAGDPDAAQEAFRVHMVNASRLTQEYMASGAWGV